MELTLRAPLRGHQATTARHTAAALAAAGWGEPRLPTRRRPGAVLMVRDYALREVGGDEGDVRLDYDGW